MVRPNTFYGFHEMIALLVVACQAIYAPGRKPFFQIFLQIAILKIIHGKSENCGGSTGEVNPGEGVNEILGGLTDSLGLHS